MSEDNVSFKDFTRKRKAVKFVVDDSGDVFHAAPALPVSTTQLLAKIAVEINQSNQLEKLDEFFGEVLLDDGAAKLKSKMQNKANPLDSEQATEILFWLLEVYGLRPTKSSPDSSSGSPTGDAGTSFTDGA